MQHANDDYGGARDSVPDPPQHTAMRRKIARFFTPNAVRRLEPRIRQIVDDAYEAVRDRDEADLYRDFAAQVSVPHCT